MQRIKTNIKILAIAIAIAVLALLLQHHNLLPLQEGTNQSDRYRSSSDSTTQNGIPAQATLGKDRIASAPLWKSGKPSPAIPAMRGANKERQYGTPKTSQVPDVIENSIPSIMAMTPADGRKHLLPEETDQYTLKSRRNLTL